MTPARGSVHLVVGTELTDMARALSAELTAADVAVETIPDPDTARERVGNGPVRGVLVSDDEFDGLAVFEALRAVDTAVPVALVSTEPDPQRVTEALTAGVTDYVETTMPASLLAAKLDAYAQRWPTDWRAGTELWDDISSGVSHDAKNPLNVIMGRFELLDIGEPHEEPLLRSVDRVERILTDLSRIGSIARPVRGTEPLSLAEVAAEAWPSEGYDGATLDVTTAAIVDADPERLRLLFEEVFDNAVTHSEESVTITVGDTETGFYVADDGPGVPEADRDQVFDLGFGTAREGEGYGLFLVDVAARAHGWTASISESESGGTRIDITF